MSRKVSGQIEQQQGRQDYAVQAGKGEREKIMATAALAKNSVGAVLIDAIIDLHRGEIVPIQIAPSESAVDQRP